MNIVRSALIMFCSTLLILHAGTAYAYSDYARGIDIAAAQVTAPWPQTVQAEIDMTLVQVHQTARADIATPPDRQVRSGPAILLVLGLCLSGLALWGRKRHQTT